MRKRVAEERHAAQNDECANDRADDSNQNRGNYSALYELVL
jgi:hypothetical protein